MMLGEDGGGAFAEGWMAGETKGFEVDVAVLAGGVLDGTRARGGFG
jgi:hypothetical protein